MNQTDLFITDNQDMNFIRREKVMALFILFSVILHIALLAHFNSTPKILPSDINTSRGIDITLTKYIPAPPQINKPPITPIKETQATTAIDHQVITSDIEKPLLSNKIEAATEVKAIEKPQIIQAAATSLPVNSKLLSDIKNQYLKTIASHLDKHKYYPRSAQRRHIEGEVNVTFDLLQNGHILNLKVMSKHSALERATITSINSALPMPERPDNIINLNIIPIEYTMKFSLTG